MSKKQKVKLSVKCGSDAGNHKFIYLGSSDLCSDLQALIARRDSLSFSIFTQLQQQTKLHRKREQPYCNSLGGSLDVMGSSTSQGDFDYLFKLLLIGDSGVGKSSLLLRFTSDEFDEISPTVGVDFKLKFMTVGGKRLKLTIWDTAGQERFRTLTSSYYRGAQGIILVYDVTRRETFTNLSDVWLKEVELYSTNQDCIKLLVGNKVDRDSERVVSKQEGIAFARQNGCLFLECSAKTRVNVENCFEELVLKILDTPSLLADSTSGARKNIFKQEQGIDGNSGSCC